MKNIRATTFIQVNCKCPYCDAYLDIFDEESVKESLGEDHRADGCNLEIDCPKCEVPFVVTDIDF